jgi:hypothetical protein
VYCGREYYEKQCGQWAELLHRARQKPKTDFPDINTLDQAISAAKDEGFTSVKAAVMLANEVERLRGLLGRWATLYPEPCRADHHGHCQEHYCESMESCIVKLAREAAKGNDNG